MNDLVSEGIFLVSAVTAIFVMVTVIVKKRRKQKKVDHQRQKDHFERTSPNQSEILNLGR